MYDDFLKKTHPKKYIKFANFCPKCTLFRNPQQVREQRESGENAKEIYRCELPAEPPRRHCGLSNVHDT